MKNIYKKMKKVIRRRHKANDSLHDLYYLDTMGWYLKEEIKEGVDEEKVNSMLNYLNSLKEVKLAIYSTNSDGIEDYDMIIVTYNREEE